tara:strand:+ start:55 stop:204 length:150 start_codon:yes stop_codon:yes gene_type:complete
MLDKQAYIALEVFCENILPPKVRWPKDEDDNLPNVIHLHKDEDKEDKDE